MMFNAPMTTLDIINVAKVLTGMCLVACAAFKGMGLRQAVYMGMHMSYITWWMLEQWLYPPFGERFGTVPGVDTDSAVIDWISIMSTIGVGYAWAGYLCFSNDKPVAALTVAISIACFGLGSAINLMSDLQMQATKLALATVAQKQGARAARILVTDGIFRLSRNPAYFGDWLRYFSFCLISGRPASFLLLAYVVVFNLGYILPIAKSGMAERYGSAFESWVKATPSQFVPWPTMQFAGTVAAVACVWLFTYRAACMLKGRARAVDAAAKAK
ncbi:hypothetical protein T492DRAFT_1014015 [Pavlovales sp. CCMP2436]|nr:hypothetical protein T492DRAFT_1014015 [Pavlovales sp. CCMP2436]